MSSLLMESLGWALLHSLWQGALVALLLAVALATVGRRAAQARYALACGALVLSLALPAVSGFRHYPQARAADLSSVEHAPRMAAPRTETRRMAAPMRAVETARPRVEAPERVSPLEWLRSAVASHLRWLVLAWVAGVGLCSGRMTAEWVKLRRLAASARPAPVEWQERLDALSGRLGLGRAVRLLQSAAVDVPAAVGWLSPVVLLPVSALSGLSTRQLEMVLAHELAHIRRHDFAVNLAQVLVETLLFYHPAVRWVSHVIRVEREHCCDDVAVSTSGGALSYARALTALEELRVLPTVQGPAMSALGGSLPERVRRLVTTPSARCSSRWVAGASVLTLASSLAVAAPLTSLVLGRTETAPASEAAAPRLPAAGAAPPAMKNALLAPAVIAPVPGVPGAQPPAPPAPPAAPKPGARDSDDMDEDTRVGTGQPLSVDQLVALKVAGVTPARVQELEAMGYTPTVGNLVAMSHAGVTPEYAKDMSARFGRKLEAEDLVQMKHLGVTPAYLEALKASGFSTNDPDDVVQARAVGVNEAYVRELKNAGYTGMPLEDIAQLRAVGVDAAYIQALGQRGLPKLAADDLTQLRAVGVTPEWLDRMREAGLKDLSVDELVRLRSGGVDADFIRKLRDSRQK